MWKRINLYLQGRFYENRIRKKSTEQALAAYQRAVELDPKFALAWAGLARAAHLVLQLCDRGRP